VRPEHNLTQAQAKAIAYILFQVRSWRKSILFSSPVHIFLSGFFFAYYPLIFLGILLFNHIIYTYRYLKLRNAWMRKNFDAEPIKPST
jgi:hypothetical protein